MTRKVAVFGFLVFGCIAEVAAGADRPADLEIKRLVAENIRATQAGDVPAILATIHPESLAQTTIPEIADALKAYKLKYEAPSVSFVSMSGEYALIRVVQRTTRVDGPDFLDNEIDGIWALRMDGSTWKYWTQMALSFRPLGKRQ